MLLSSKFFHLNLLPKASSELRVGLERSRRVFIEKFSPSLFLTMLWASVPEATSIILRPVGVWECACPGKAPASRAAADKAIQKLEKRVILGLLFLFMVSSVGCNSKQPTQISSSTQNGLPVEPLKR